MSPETLVPNDTLKFTFPIHSFLDDPSHSVLSPPLNSSFVLSLEPQHLANLYGLIIIHTDLPQLMMGLPPDKPIIS